MKGDYSPSFSPYINKHLSSPTSFFVLQSDPFKNFILYFLTNFWHTSHRPDPPRKSKNKERAAEFHSAGFLYESLALGNFNNLLAASSRASRRDVYLTFSPCIRKLHFAMALWRDYAHVAWRYNGIFGYCYAAPRNRAHPSATRRIAPLLTFARVPRVRWGRASE